jgi:hypothetical protein
VRGGDVVDVCEEVSTAYTTCVGRCGMTRWLPRSFWLLAWSFWVWLGFGLYLELPRGLGPPVAAVPALDVAPEAGFLADTNRFALVRRHGALGGVVETYDAESGALLAATPAPGMGDLLWPDCFLGGRGVLLAKALPNEDGTESAPGLHVLDLRAGRWRRVTTQTVQADVQRDYPHQRA